MNKKFNIVDFAFITLILLILFGIFFKIFFVNDSKSQKTHIKTVYYQVENQRTEPKIIKFLKTGANLYNNYDKVEACITHIEVKPSTHTIDTADGRIVQAKDYAKRDLIVTIKARVVDDKSKPYSRVGSQDLIVGQDFNLKTDKAIIKGIIISIK